MKSLFQTTIVKDLENKKLNITREFAAPVEQVWNAWTDPEILDLWWAPKPYQTKTKSMDLRGGGAWLYKMEGPDGNGEWCKVDYLEVEPNLSFSGLDGFCDEAGNMRTDFPSMHWKCTFSESANGTLVAIEVTFAEIADLEKIMEMGFAEGFTAAHGNLDEVFSKVQATSPV